MKEPSKKSLHFEAITSILGTRSCKQKRVKLSIHCFIFPNIFYKSMIWKTLKNKTKKSVGSNRKFISEKRDENGKQKKCSVSEAAGPLKWKARVIHSLPNLFVIFVGFFYKSMIWKIRPDKLTAFEISSAEEKKAKKRPDPKATVATKLLPPTA